MVWGGANSSNQATACLSTAPRCVIDLSKIAVAMRATSGDPFQACWSSCGTATFGSDLLNTASALTVTIGPAVISRPGSESSAITLAWIRAISATLIGHQYL